MIGTNGTAKRFTVADGKAKGGKAKGKKAVASDGGLKAWAYGGAVGTLALSGWLNGMAFSLSAPEPAHGWVLGVAIPVGILTFSRVSALLWGRGRRRLAGAGGVACLSMLLLSVQHCAASIARLTGEPLALAALMALAIDAGLVVCELATLRK